MNKKYHVSNLIGLKDPDHSMFEFVDVNLESDQKLFIDPGLIALYNDDWCKEVRNHIDDFFNVFYKLYRDNDTEKKFNLLSYASEINYTKLGYGNGDNGHGNRANGLLKTFEPLELLINRISSISNSIDLPVMISGFNEDGLSDMITNIIHKQLNDFTLQVLNGFGKKPNSTDKFYTWDINCSSWQEIEAPCYKHNGKKILLTPKRIVRKKYLFSANHFLNRVILEKQKEESAYIVEDSKKKKKKKYKYTKKELRRRISKNNKDWRYVYIKKQTEEDSNLLDIYHTKLIEFYEDKGMTDIELDKFIY